ncbi:hypothetical protein HDU76_003599 [Blyttiomyces sp. JEL0837]|nr:hypothetical protein HDU76_003599 [Blyttiomyces sp. JEL0837]
MKFSLIAVTIAALLNGASNVSAAPVNPVPTPNNCEELLGVKTPVMDVMGAYQIVKIGNSPAPADAAYGESPVCDPNGDELGSIYYIAQTGDYDFVMAKEDGDSFANTGAEFMFKRAKKNNVVTVVTPAGTVAEDTTGGFVVLKNKTLSLFFTMWNQGCDYKLNCISGNCAKNYWASGYTKKPCPIPLNKTLPGAKFNDLIGDYSVVSVNGSLAPPDGLFPNKGNLVFIPTLPGTGFSDNAPIATLPVCFFIQTRLDDGTWTSYGPKLCYYQSNSVFNGTSEFDTINGKFFSSNCQGGKAAIKFTTSDFSTVIATCKAGVCSNYNWICPTPPAKATTTTKAALTTTKRRTTTTRATTTTIEIEEEENETSTSSSAAASATSREKTTTTSTSSAEEEEDEEPTSSSSSSARASSTTTTRASSSSSSATQPPTTAAAPSASASASSSAAAYEDAVQEAYDDAYFYF